MLRKKVKKLRGRKPKLTEEECADIRRLYHDPAQKLHMSHLARWFRVSEGLIQKVLDGKYEKMLCGRKQMIKDPIRCGK